MSREIKFRAWNGEEMISPDYITRDGVAHWKQDSIPTYSKELFQFTGLHDKNGKEIYEGDLLRSLTGLGFPVVFNEGEFEAVVGRIIIHRDSWGEREVIGNIKQNPELLS